MCNWHIDNGVDNEHSTFVNTILNMKSLIALSFCLILTWPISATNIGSASVVAYVEAHRVLAMQEMKRSGIPASILLGQAILASDHGSKELAADFNNHFAMKCGHAWDNETIFSKDDNSIVEVCYRAYPDAKSSFADYTDMVMNSRSCRDLFQNSYYDFEAWAQGLGACLHQSDKQYAARLIKLIKKFDLTKYDSPAVFSPAVKKPIIGYEFEID